MKITFYFSLFLLFLSGCGSELETVRPGRGAEREVGPMVKVYPSGDKPRIDRHGLWRGMNGEKVVWEVRYTRGVPTGPYREWNAEGELFATWPYNWEGEIDGWARWFKRGEPDGKMNISTDAAPDFEVVGSASVLKDWMMDQPHQD